MTNQHPSQTRIEQPTLSLESLAELIKDEIRMASSLNQALANISTEIDKFSDKIADRCQKLGFNLPKLDQVYSKTYSQNSKANSQPENVSEYNYGKKVRIVVPDEVRFQWLGIFEKEDFPNEDLDITEDYTSVNLTNKISNESLKSADISVSSEKFYHISYSEEEQSNAGIYNMDNSELDKLITQIVSTEQTSFANQLNGSQHSGENNSFSDSFITAPLHMDLISTESNIVDKAFNDAEYDQNSEYNSLAFKAVSEKNKDDVDNCSNRSVRITQTSDDGSEVLISKKSMNFNDISTNDESSVLSTNFLFEDIGSADKKSILESTGTSIDLATSSEIIIFDNQAQDESFTNSEPRVTDISKIELVLLESQDFSTNLISNIPENTLPQFLLTKPTNEPIPSILVSEKKLTNSEIPELNNDNDDSIIKEDLASHKSQNNTPTDISSDTRNIQVDSKSKNKISFFKKISRKLSIYHRRSSDFKLQT
ncbi:hypothetical protein BB561_000077 [Smittium simulii]|uniref:Uncharacterized protein n=1 Tax=Smittium simulii TaxID=133385 RepID=A0A2T9Z0V1_9FUNG|nr:hypothetical protein BB561_000077 [Smittium simulii]